MKKIKVLLAVLLFASGAKAQFPSQRSPATITVMDARAKFNLNMVGPHYADTTHANTNIGLDSLGALAYIDADSSYYYRAMGANGLKFWKKFSQPGSSAVTSFNTRNGAVVPITGDYNASQVTNAVSTLGGYPDPTWITSLNWNKIINTPTTIPGYGITDGVTFTGTQTLTNKTLTSPILNFGSDATGDIYYRKSDGTVGRLAIGTAGQQLVIKSGLAAWAGKATPGIISDVFASRPAAGNAGVIFISTDTKVIYRDNGSSWDVLSSPSVQTLQQVLTAGSVLTTDNTIHGGLHNLTFDSLSGLNITNQGITWFRYNDGSNSSPDLVSIGDVDGVAGKTKLLIDDGNALIQAIALNGLSLILNTEASSNRIVLKTQTGFTGNNNIYLPGYVSGSDTLATKADVRAASSSFTLTTTGTGGNATFSGGTLNIPNYTYALPTATTSLLGGVKPDGTTITISGGVISSNGGLPNTITSPVDGQYLKFDVTSGTWINATFNKNKFYPVNLLHARNDSTPALGGNSDTSYTVLNFHNTDSVVLDSANFLFIKKLPNKAPTGTDSLTLIAADGRVYKTPALSNVIPQSGTLTTRLSLSPSVSQLFWQTNGLKGLYAYTGTKWVFNMPSRPLVMNENFSGSSMQLAASVSGTGATAGFGAGDATGLCNSVIAFACGSTTTGKSGAFVNTNTNLYLDNNYAEYRVRLAQSLGSATDTSKFQIGGNGFGDGVFFLLDPSLNGGRWLAVTIKSGTVTATDTGITPDLAYHIFGINYISSTDIEFYIDDVLVATNTTNIPLVGTWAFGIGAELLKRVGTTSHIVYMDYIKIYSLQGY